MGRRTPLLSQMPLSRRRLRLHPAPPPPLQPLHRAAHNLVGTIEQVQGAAGSTIIDVSLRNDGPSCTVAGFPGVSLIDVDGSQIGAAADREPASATPQSLMLATGDAASFSVRSTNALAFDPKECNTIDSTALKVYPPADTEWVTLPLTAEMSKSTRYLPGWCVKWREA